MFARFPKPPEFDRIAKLSRDLESLIGLNEIYLSYRHNDQTYRLTSAGWFASSNSQATPVFEDRGYLAGEMIDQLMREIGLLELESRLDEEEKACRRYKSERSDYYIAPLAVTGDEAFINMLVAQVQI